MPEWFAELKAWIGPSAVLIPAMVWMYHTINLLQEKRIETTRETLDALNRNTSALEALKDVVETVLRQRS